MNENTKPDPEEDLSLIHAAILQIQESEQHTEVVIEDLRRSPGNGRRIARELELLRTICNVRQELLDLYRRCAGGEECLERAMDLLGQVMAELSEMQAEELAGVAARK